MTDLIPAEQDKILQSTSGRADNVTVTNDGATILKAVMVDNPAAKILIDISKSQDEEVGDGTTSVCVLAGELLREAERLMEKNVHPQTIIAGYREATQTASKALQAAAVDHKSNPGMCELSSIAAFLCVSFLHLEPLPLASSPFLFLFFLICYCVVQSNSARTCLRLHARR